MIEVIIFYLHIVGGVFVYTKYWQRGSIREGFMGLALLALMFSIGWVMMSFIVGLIYPSSWETLLFRKDTVSLLLLSIMELYFFIKFFLKDK